MRNCKYDLNINGVSVTLNGDRELTDFIKENLKENKEGIKFSLTPQSKGEEIFEILKSKPSQRDTTSTNTPYTFIEKQHLIEGNLSYLVPQFRTEKYKESLRVKLKSIVPKENLSDKEYAEKLNLEVEEIIKTNEVTEKFSIDFARYFRHALLKKINPLSKNSWDNELKGIIKKILEYNNGILGVVESITDDQIEKHFSHIRKEIDNLIDDLTSQEWYRLQVGQNVSIDNQLINPDVQMHDLIHILGIKEDGKTDLFEIKVSQNAYDNWDDTKKQKVDYILGIHRQLLGNFIDVSETKLRLIELIITKKEVNGKKVFNLDSFTAVQNIERTQDDLDKIYGGEGTKPLNFTKGKITNRLRALLPANMPISKKVSTGLVEKVTDQLEMIFPKGKYEFKTKSGIDAEKLYNKILKDQEKLSEASFVDYTSTHRQKVSVSKSDPNWKEKFKTLLNEYAERYNSDKHSRTKSLVTQIEGMKNRTGAQWNGIGTIAEMTLDKYTEKEWQFLNSSLPELTELDTLVFFNNKTNEVEVVVLTNNALDKVYNLGRGSTILGKFKTNDQVRNLKLFEASGTRIELIKGLLVLNGITGAIKNCLLSDIRVLNLNPHENKAGWEFMNPLIENFNFLLSTLKQEYDTTIENNFVKNKVNLGDSFLSLYRKITENPELQSNTSDALKIKGILSKHLIDEPLTDKYRKLQWFKSLRDEIINPTNRLKGKLVSDMKKVDNSEGVLQTIWKLVNEGVMIYSGLFDVFDYNLPTLGIDKNNLLHLPRAIIHGKNVPTHDENGKKIVGFLQGSLMSSSDAWQTRTFNNLLNMVEISNDKIASEFQTRQLEVTTKTDEYYRKLGRSKLEEKLIGIADPYHKNFFERDKITGEITSDFKFKNPWSESADLTEIERDYLKNMIFILFKYSSYNTYGYTTLKEFEESEMFFDISLGEHPIFYAPLVKSQSLTSLKPTTGNFRKWIGRMWDNVKDALDPEPLTEEERMSRFNSVNGFRQIYNQYERGNDLEGREKIIEKYTPGHFEINLDTLVLKFMLESLRTKYLNNVMLDISSAVVMLKTHAGSTGRVKELEEALDVFWDQIKLSVLNTSIIEGEERDLLALARKAQRVASLMVIALRPVLLAKELTVGFYKNASFAFFKTYGEDSFGEEDLLKGYSEILNPTQESFIINDSINATYRIANYDLNQVVDKKKVDRGALNFLSDKLYWFSTAPDYVNRMSLFVAKMKKDGCYDAHTLEDGKLKYNPFKDERYGYYLRNRDKYKNEKGDFVFAKNDLEFNTQRARYQAVIQEFNKENISLGEPLFTEETIIKKAYTTTEKNAIKTFTDTAYGYYDHSRTPAWFGRTSGILFGQFMKYWPSKIKYYFDPGEKDTTVGYMGQNYRENDDGTRTLLYKKEVYDEDGNITDILHVSEAELEPGDEKVPLEQWVGSLSEGLFYSLIYTGHDLYNGKNIDLIDPRRLRQAKLALHDILFAIISALLGSWFMANKKDFKNQPMMAQTGLTILYKSMNDLNVMSSVFGGLQTTPAFFSILSSAKDDLKQVLSGDQPIYKMIRDNLKMLELLPYERMVGRTS